MRNKYLLLLISALCLFVRSFAQGYKTQFVVAEDGSGDFTSIQKAIEAAKSFPYERITIYIKNGIYPEKVLVPAWNTMLSLIGENKDSVIIVYGDYFGKINKGPNSTFYTPAVQISANDCLLKNLTIENNAGPVGQAIALAVSADRCVVNNCAILGNQDALYVSGENNRQYFKDCTITGTTDFIFGEATTLFDSCHIVCKSNSFITAASTPPDVQYGLVFRNCAVTALAGVDHVILGRTWRKYAKTVFINCTMGNFIAPAGWKDWGGSTGTAFYAEYHSMGIGANTTSRVKWAHQLTKTEVEKYHIENIFRGWIPK